jgi:hypothetical protein
MKKIGITSLNAFREKKAQQLRKSRMIVRTKTNSRRASANDQQEQ